MLSFSFIGVALTFVTEKNGVAFLPYVFMSVMMIPGFAVAVRRLHDTGRSAWFLLLNLIPGIGGILLFILFVLPGDKGENRYGKYLQDDGVTFFDKPKAIGIAFIISFFIAFLIEIGWK